MAETRGPPRGTRYSRTRSSSQTLCTHDLARETFIDPDVLTQGHQPAVRRLELRAKPQSVGSQKDGSLLSLWHGRCRSSGRGIAVPQFVTKTPRARYLNSGSWHPFLRQR